MEGKTDGLESMPGEIHFRAEMFYVAGVLYEKRGNAKRARELFEMAAKEDPIRKWASVLAEQRLGATG